MIPFLFKLFVEHSLYKATPLCRSMSILEIFYWLLDQGPSPLGPCLGRTKAAPAETAGAAPELRQIIRRVP